MQRSLLELADQVQEECLRNTEFSDKHDALQLIATRLYALFELTDMLP